MDKCLIYSLIFLVSGPLAFLRLTVLLLLLIVMTAILPGHWPISNDVTCWIMTNKKEGAQDYNNNDFRNINFTNNVITTHNFNSTDELPSTCKLPQVNLYEPSVLQLSGMNKTTIRCEGTYLPEFTYITKDNTLTVNMSMVMKYMDVRDLEHCTYKLFFRHEMDNYNVKFSRWSNPFRDKIQLPGSAEFVEVVCSSKTFKVVSRAFYGLVPKKEQYNEMEFLNLKKRQVMSAPKETLNIIMVGMDSLFRNQFIRGCNKTYSYLMNSLNSFDLSMHSQVGDNTFPNILALFTGSSLQEINSWWTHEYHMDNFDLIWRTFENAGYRTLFTEDSVRGTFFYLKRGFIHPFAMYNTRPLSIAMFICKDLYQNESRCAGNQVEMNFHLNYVNRFLETFPDKPSFSVLLFTKPTHDDPSDARMFDEHLWNFYRSLNLNGHLNGSLLVSFSDHGVRYGTLRNTVNGHVESRTPYTILTFPDWFLKKYPDVAMNLKINTKRLTSHFDTHATLLDLLYFKGDTPPPLPPLRHGISLFKTIPFDRTCKDASIPAEFCLCGYEDLGKADTSSDLSKILTSLVIEALNSKTDKNICAVFQLHRIISIHKIAMNSNNSKGKHDTFLYQVQLVVTPGNAQFAANVYTENNTTGWQVGYNIDRLNSYHGQADCLKLPLNMMYCYCKNLLPK
ncbi:unnamed protein product [Candidula unifasciata]|uniref:Uncharacterized protein n=1 Tax=Candidula unifasciata TaxID=100452 RepID=A0A8S3ZZ48_9EUPU|nr:unnamed protein product [Candidula unifasciata]